MPDPTLADVLLYGAGGAGGNFGTMTPQEEAVAVTPGSVLDTMATRAATLPQRAFQASENLRQGGDYDPAPAVETAGYMVGGGAAGAERGALGSGGARMVRPETPAIVTRANPTQADIDAIYSSVAGKGRAGWPDTADPVFATTPEAYGETEGLVPQQQIRGQLPQVNPSATLPLKDRARPIAENVDPISERIAQRLEPMVSSDSPLLKFYDTGPVNRGLSEHAGLSPDEANQFMRDWSGQGAATSPRTQTPTNLRNSSYLLYNRAQGTPVDPASWAAEGNRSGFPMMGMHVDLANQFARGEESGFYNPKPVSFRENWSGNMQPVTSDTHNIRSTLYEMDQLQPGSLPRGWFTSDEAYKIYKEGGGFPPEGELKPGAINDELGGSTVNKQYAQTEYPVMTAPWERAAEKLGIAPARAQSAGWFGYGPITGLKSPPKTIPELLNNQIGATADVLGVSPAKVLEWWGQRKIPLAGVAGTAGMGEVLRAYGDQPEAQ